LEVSLAGTPNERCGLCKPLPSPPPTPREVESSRSKQLSLIFFNKNAYFLHNGKKTVGDKMEEGSSLCKS